MTASDSDVPVHGR